MELDNHSIAQLKSLLGAAKRCLVVAHVNPDGDAVGSSLGWASCLQKAYPALELRVFLPNNYPCNLSWITGADKIMVYSDEAQRPAMHDYIKSCDLVFCLDASLLARMDELGKLVLGHPAPRVLVDHHIDPATEEFTLIFSDTTACSTCELVYRLLDAMGYAPLIDLDVAEALYVGLVTDTGSFSYNINTPETFRIAAGLMERGLDKNGVTSKVFDNFSEKRMRLMGYCLQTKMRVLAKYGAAYISLSRAELEDFGFQAGDTEGIVNLPLSIKGIGLAAFFTEALDRSHIRVSLRSTGTQISVDKMARQYFNGGGHFNAAGGRYFESLENCEAFFEKIVKHEL
ncbi:MAG: bifunctional oligoribonuclease/PAP phosphatase NrnA [Prevotellaceae bacterium]|nr:bifunctional oligoribonuclease/PAP phosphatase NrnA [Prevotellaceae bacterium]